MEKLKEVIIGVLLVLVLPLYLGCSGFIQWGIGHDITKYGDRIRAADLPLDVKLRLLEKLDALPVEKIGFFRWVEFDNSVKEMLSKRVNDEDALLLEREIDRLLNELTRRRRISSITKFRMARSSIAGLRECFLRGQTWTSTTANRLPSPTSSASDP